MTQFQPCSNCRRGLVPTTNEVCPSCSGTGYVQDNPVAPEQVEVSRDEKAEKALPSHKEKRAKLKEVIENYKKKKKK